MYAQDRPHKNRATNPRMRMEACSPQRKLRENVASDIRVRVANGRSPLSPVTRACTIHNLLPRSYRPWLHANVRIRGLTESNSPQILLSSRTKFSRKSIPHKSLQSLNKSVCRAMQLKKRCTSSTGMYRLIHLCNGFEFQGMVLFYPPIFGDNKEYK